MNIPDIISHEDLTQHLFLHYLEKTVKICIQTKFNKLKGSDF